MDRAAAASRRPAARIWSRRAGTALAAIAAAYVAVRFLRGEGDAAPPGIPAVLWLCAAGLSVPYAGAHALLALAWRTLLEMQGAHADRTWCLRTYGVSQIAKYLPGNVGHFVSRQLLGASAGVPQAVLARSSLYEVAGLAAAGLLLGLPALPLIDDRLFRWAAPPAAAAIVLAVLAAVRLKAGARPAQVLAAHLLFLLAASFVFTTLFALTAPDPGLSWPTVCGAYAAAWLAGFVTPGAPAGLGVRELVLVFLLDGRASEQDLLPAVVLSRAVTMLGDAVFFGAAAWTGRPGGLNPSTRSKGCTKSGMSPP